jgi:hypothetical protein
VSITIHNPLGPHYIVCLYSSIGVWGEATQTTAGASIGVLAKGPIAGRFEEKVEVTGVIEVTGDIKLLNADCAEDFDIVEENVEVGTVMVLTENGSLQQSYQEYDKKVAGIVSGGRGHKPAMILDRQNSEKQKDKERMPNLNGLELLKTSNPNVRTILMSAYNFEEDILFLKYMEEGIIDSTIDKPVTMNSLYQRVRDELQANQLTTSN